MTFLSNLFRLFLLGAICIALLAAYSWHYYDSPGPLSQEKTVLFKRGEGFREIVDDLAEQGVIRNPLLFKAIAVIQGDARKFKAGEYHFSAAISPRLVIHMIAEGKVVAHKLVIPEGLTVREVIQLLKNEPALEGDINANMKEGSLLPETYHFVYGDKRQELIDRMQAGMTSLLKELWDKRQENLPFETLDQAVTLASIIEKETGVDNERKRVAAVFINRLRKNMKLQSDPTVIYGVELKNGKSLDRALTLDDLHSDTPYNTYFVFGLPPGPIANPGCAAIEAALHPASTADLYFVATGKGGHNFASTLEEHVRNVKAYRDKLKQGK